MPIFLLKGMALLLLSGVDSKLMEASFETYWLLAKIMLGLTTVTALGRIVLNNLSLGSYESLKSILKDSLKFILCVALAPMVIKQALLFVDSAALKIGSNQESAQLKKAAELELNNTNASLQKANKAASSIELSEETRLALGAKMNNDYVISPLTFMTSDFGDLIKWLSKLIAVSIAEFLEYLRNIVLALLIAATPLFLYLGLMLGLRFFSNLVLSLGVSLLIWPLLSAILLRFSVLVFDSRSETLWTSFSQGISLIIFSLAQLLLPFFALKGGLSAAAHVMTGVGASAKGISKGASNGARFFIERNKRE